MPTLFRDRALTSELLANVFVTPEMFGARGDPTSDTLGIARAAATGRIVVFLPRTYQLADLGNGDNGIAIPGVVAGATSQKWIGSGAGKTVLQVSADTSYDPIFFNNVNDIFIYGMTFDGNGHLNVGASRYAFYCAPLFINNCDGCVIEDCEFIGWATCGLHLNEAKNTIIRGNRTERLGGVDTTAPNFGIICFGKTGDSFNDVMIDKNVCLDSAISTAGNHFTLTNNTVIDWGFSSGFNFQFDDSYYIVVGNHIDGGGNKAADLFGTIQGGFEAWANYSVYANNHIKNCPGNGIGGGGHDGLIIGNICLDNGQNTLADLDNRNGIVLASPDASHNGDRTIVIGNHCSNTGGGATQVYGFREAGTNDLVDAVVGDNFFKGNATADASFHATTTVDSAFAPWQAVAITPTGGLGAFTTVTGTVTKKYLAGQLELIEFTVNVTDVGTASTSVFVVSPYQWVGLPTFAGYNTPTKKAVVGRATNSNTVEITYADGTFPGATGADILLNGIVQRDY